MQARNIKPDSFHCTIYAIKALQAGFGNEFTAVEKLHKKHWGNREYAGWSIAYILTRYYNWNAYLIINEQSEEYDRCVRNFNNRREYYVWRQPDIKLEKLFIMGKDEEKINGLLSENEFGWGFSYQGIHTWITRFAKLKECRWDGAPGKDFDYCDDCSPLFITHDFSYYTDYISHVVVFPPKK